MSIINVMPYAIGKPGMLASHTPAHLQEFMGEEPFNINKTDRIFPYGRVLHRKANGDLDLADQNGVLEGIALWPEGLEVDPTGYIKGTYVSRITLGDVWVPVKSGLTITPGQPAYYLKTAGDDLGKFINVATGANPYPGATFQSPVYNKTEPIALLRLTLKNFPAPASTPSP